MKLLSLMICFLQSHSQNGAGGVADGDAQRIRKALNARMDHMIPHDGSIIGSAARQDTSGKLHVRPCSTLSPKICMSKYLLAD